ncbi:hypothetical protein Ddc_08749 [Ditylenchus destructor]|nr:hypothetical protein Ddc_08749 [Ditylenchus destructor]
MLFCKEFSGRLFVILPLVFVACNSVSGASIRKSTRVHIAEDVTAKADNLIYKPYTYSDQRTQHNYFYRQPQQQSYPYYNYQQPTNYYYQQQPTYYYPSYSYPSFGGLGGGGGIFGFCLLCFGIGKK